MAREGLALSYAWEISTIHTCTKNPLSKLGTCLEFRPDCVDDGNKFRSSSPVKLEPLAGWLFRLPRPPPFPRPLALTLDSWRACLGGHATAADEDEALELQSSSAFISIPVQLKRELKILWYKPYTNHSKTHKIHLCRINSLLKQHKCTSFKQIQRCSNFANITIICGFLLSPRIWPVVDLTQFITQQFCLLNVCLYSSKVFNQPLWTR